MIKRWPGCILGAFALVMISGEPLGSARIEASNGVIQMIGKRGSSGSPLRAASVLVLLSVLVLTVLTAGCYRHIPVGPADAPLNANVRVHLSGPGQQRLDGVLDPEGRHLDGRLIRRDGEAFLIEVKISRTEGFVQDGVLVQRVPVTREEIVFLQIRTVDPVRTVLLLATLAAGATALLVRTFSGEAGGGPFPPMDGGQTESVVHGLVQVGTAPLSRPRGGGSALVPALPD